MAAKAAYVAALGHTIACYLMRARKVRCTDALGPRGERVWTVHRALVPVVYFVFVGVPELPCPGALAHPDGPFGGIVGRA